MINNPITAIYENGILRPLTPLALPEQTEVQIYVQPVGSGSERLAHRRQVQEALVNAGLSLEHVAPSPMPGLLSVEQRAELAHRFSAEQPLAEFIMEEREGR